MPHLRAGGGVERLHVVADVAVAAARADDDDAVVVDRRGHQATALAPRDDLGLPDLGARLHVEGDHVAVARPMNTLPSPIATALLRPPVPMLYPASKAGVYFHRIWPVAPSSAKTSPLPIGM